MKNLLIYINPNKNFEEKWEKNGEFLWKNETESLLKVQIDHSLDLGWRREDIILVMNFPWEHNGVKSLVLDDCYCDFAPTASKINVIKKMFDLNLIGDDLYFFHDNDAFQLGPIEIDVTNEIALTDYGVTPRASVASRWSTGVMFFRKEAKDVFELLYHGVNRSYKKNEEIALLAMMRCNYAHIRERIRKIDISYNFATRSRVIDKMFEVAEKPLKVIHFHPFDPRLTSEKKPNKEAVLPYISNTLLLNLKKYACI